MGLAAMFCYDLGIGSERGSKGEIESGRNTQTTDIQLPVTGSGPLRATVQARESTQWTWHLRICKGVVRTAESDGSILGRQPHFSALQNGSHCAFSLDGEDKQLLACCLGLLCGN